MKLFGRKHPELPDAVRSALTLTRGDRVMAWDRDATTGAYVVATAHGLSHVPDPDGRAAQAPSAVAAGGTRAWSRPWSDVAAGAWAPGPRTLTATWADDGRPSMWSFAGSDVSLASVFHERVQASILITAPVRIGDRDLGHVALRKDLATGALIDQISLKRGVGGVDVQAYARQLMDDLREQAGL